MQYFYNFSPPDLVQACSETRAQVPPIKQAMHISFIDEHMRWGKVGALFLLGLGPLFLQPSKEGAMHMYSVRTGAPFVHAWSLSHSVASNSLCSLPGPLSFH